MTDTDNETSICTNNTPSAEEVCNSLVPGFREVRELGARFFPARRDKSPAVSGKLSYAATDDPVRIMYWVRYRHCAGLAARIPKGCKLLVIDTEHPFKHPDKPGPDGELVFCELLEEHDITLPACPTIMTPTGGIHRYLCVPKGCRIKGTIALWPGVDVLAEGNNVLMPESKTHNGTYRVLRGFENGIPEAPKNLIKLIQAAQKQYPNHKKRNQSQSRTSSADIEPIPIPSNTESGITRRTWCRLFRNRVFARLWNGKKQRGDTTPSGYAYHLAKASLCNGLDAEQTFEVIALWRNRHGLPAGRKALRKIRRAIIPAAWREVGSWVSAEQAQRKHRQLKPRGRKRSETTLRILAARAEHPELSLDALAQIAATTPGNVRIVLHRYPNTLYKSSDTRNCVTLAESGNDRLPADLVDTAVASTAHDPASMPESLTSVLESSDTRNCVTRRDDVEQGEPTSRPLKVADTSMGNVQTALREITSSPYESSDTRNCVTHNSAAAPIPEQMAA